MLKVSVAKLFSREVLSFKLPSDIDSVNRHVNTGSRSLVGQTISCPYCTYTNLLAFSGQHLTAVFEHGINFLSFLYSIRLNQFTIQDFAEKWKLYSCTLTIK